MLTTTAYRAALYCRLSSDDGNAGDSSSIQTQKAMLEKYCRDNGFPIVDFYIDDGYSGLNFNRPAFTKLLDDIDRGTINLVITKDLSRLGRDYIQTGYYMEVYFSKKNVRYIALNDAVDTIRQDNDVAPFKNILNDMYSRDLSRKIRSAKKQRALRGDFQAGQAPLGYKIDPNNKAHLIIDEEAATIVKEIFRLALEGNGSVKIAKILTQNKVITPAAYKARKGDTRFDHFFELRGSDWEYLWYPPSVRRIIGDQVYTGDMVNGKCEIKNYKTKKRTLAPVENHIIVQNTHEPLISKEDFARVQKLIEGNKRPERKQYENIFKGILICRECNHRLAIARIVRESGRECKYYYCKHHVSHPTRCTHSNIINYNDIVPLITERLRHFINIVKDTEKFSTLLSKKTQELNQLNSYYHEKNKAEKRLDDLVNITMKIYEDNATGIISNDIYQRMVVKYKEEQINLNNRIAEINRSIEQTKAFNENIGYLKQAVEEVANFKVLTREIVCKFISKIYIEPIKNENGEKTRELIIVYRFIDIEL